ncbi:4-alpha-L-fucosyltransferase [Lobosporangium transversale]|uniref:Fucosyltransferase n=1 Tax=Lobosporangium transversale TaxID=64571 RepID=A0A1Y2H1E5_9FUNG|nr:hypothetical protein BCR41DRAFT_345165 [Lobosporangium transversale]KAF9905377.1 4-alpha-L-fucosyltransferase [Lobosporangium transversale]ORZ28355.1 hypothetical protein BCR41DRAFT_345165 [Lobosporangium transversale]|eukprot:XP_021886040.1 hypothetical protein BCR41DRAFT_345165 [Lobosporangium transversale]
MTPRSHPLFKSRQKILVGLAVALAAGLLLLELYALNQGRQDLKYTNEDPVDSEQGPHQTPDYLSKNEEEDLYNTPPEKIGGNGICNNLPEPRHPRKLLISHKDKGQPIRILRWSFLPYWREIDWKKESLKLCPFPHELQIAIDRYKETTVKDMSLSWGKGYAPCYLWEIDYDDAGSCETEQHGKIEYTITHNYTQFRTADIIWMNSLFPFYTSEAPWFDAKLLPPRLADHKWVSNFHSESVAYYPFVALPEYNQLFDLTVGSPPSMMDVPMPMYPISHEMALDLANVEPSYPFDRKPRDYIAFFVSNCWSKNSRERLMQGLIDGIGAHSFGNCLHNKDLNSEPSGKNPNWEQNKKEKLKEYPFVLAAENSNCLGYVSEKIYDALAIGAVPIYLGADDINDYVPEGSYINAADFKDTNELVKYMRNVDRSQFFRWKADVKQDVTKFCKKCFGDKNKKLECSILERIEYV